MKLTIILIFAFLAMTLCGTGVPKSNLRIPGDHRPIDNLRYFFLTIFDQFGLDEPEDLIGCFDDKTAAIFFKSLFEFHEILTDTKERNEIRLHFDYLKLKILAKGLESVHECVIESDDYDELLDAMGVEERDSKKLMIYKYIYYQAEYEDLLEDFTSVVENLEDQDHKAAGIAYYRLLKRTVNNIKKLGVFFLANQGFGNGFSLRFGLSDPRDSLKCWNDSSSETFLKFLCGLSSAVVNGSWYESPVNARIWWDTWGSEIWDAIPDKVWSCLGDSKDYEMMIGKIGKDIFDDNFGELLLRYINNHRLNFFLTMKGIRHSFDKFNVNHAGFVFGHLIQRIARTSDDTIDE